MSYLASGSGWQQGRKTDDLMQYSLLTQSPKKTGSKSLGATQGQPASKKQKLSSKTTRAESTESEGDSDDPIDSLRVKKRMGVNKKTYGQSRTIQRGNASLASSPNKPNTTASSRKGKKDEIIDVDDSPPPKPSSRPRPRTKAKPLPSVAGKSRNDTDVSDEEQDESPRPSRKGKGKAQDFPMELNTSKQPPKVASFPLYEEDNGADDTIMLVSSDRQRKPGAAPFPMTATQLGSPPTHRPIDQDSHRRTDSQFSSHRSNDEEVISDSEGEKTNLSPHAFPSPPSSKRRSSEPDEESGQLSDRKKKRKKVDNVTYEGFVSARSTTKTIALDRRSSSDTSLEPTGSRVTLPPRLCPFCDEVLPTFMSTRLRNLIESLVNQTKLAPRPTHREEMQTIPRGLKMGWPRKIDFKDLPRRMKRSATRKALEAILSVPARDRDSKFWIAAREDIRKRGARVATSVQGQMETFHLTQPGYYGEQGFIVISETLQNMFSQEKLEAADIMPMNSQDFLQRVLVPETAILLIMEDRDEDYAAALKTMEDSRAFGTALFPAKDNDADVNFDISIRMLSPPKPTTFPNPTVPPKPKEKYPSTEKAARQQPERAKPSLLSIFTSDEETEKEQGYREAKKKPSKSGVLVRNSSAVSSQPSSQETCIPKALPKSLPKPSEIMKTSRSKGDTNSISSELEVQELLHNEPGMSGSTTSVLESTSLRNGQPKFLRPPRSPSPPPIKRPPVPIP
ncbi:hypothetical protein FRB90_011962, partial [Tulasnella sp. 427]